MLTVAFWCALSGVLIIAVLLVRQRQITARVRAQNAILERTQRVRDDEVWHLATDRLPLLVESMHGRQVTVPDLRHSQLTGTTFEKGLNVITEYFIESVGQAAERADHSAKTTLKAMMRTVQSLANEQQLAISNMQENFDNPDVLAGLLRIDHMNAQLGRRAQATAVLCGSWPGQQRSAATLVDVVRGATSRIRDYRRVEVNSHIEAAVISRAVEPTVLVIAELLDNAARHSQPNAPVEVNFRSAHNGIAIMIDDAGIAMEVEELRRAAQLLSGREAVDIDRLGDPPRIGFAVAGVLAARYGIRVSVDTRSPYGGVRAVVFIPTALITRIDEKPEPGRTGSIARPKSPVHQTAAEAPKTAGGLPKRKRVTSPDESSIAQRVSTTEQPANTPTRPTRQVAASLGAWQRGTQAGRVVSPHDSEGKGQS